MRESRRRRDNGGNVQTGQQPVGRTRAATAAQAGGSGDSGQRAKWVRLMMLLRLRERFSCWAGFRLVHTRKGIHAMCKAYIPRFLGGAPNTSRRTWLTSLAGCSRPSSPKGRNAASSSSLAGGALEEALFFLPTHDTTHSPTASPADRASS